MPSTASQIISKLLSVTHKITNIAINNQQQFVEQLRIDNTKPYRRPHISCAVEQLDGLGCKVYVVGSGDKWVYYLHGGAYVWQPSVFHWQFVNKLAQNGIKVVMPIYPKAPTFSASTTVPLCSSVYNNCVSRFGQCSAIIGDSAGGALAMAVAQCVMEKPNCNLPPLILYSPWLDVALNNSAIEQYQQSDVVLDTKQLRICGNLYCDQLDSTHSWVSPLYCKGIPSAVYMFVGSSEIMLPDCLLYKHLHSTDNVVVQEFKAMQHCFFLMPIPEADIVFYQTLDIINKT